MNSVLKNSRLFKKLFVNYFVPMNRTLGIKLKTMEDDRTVMVMKGNLEKNGKCELELKSAITDSQGDTVAELTALYFIKRLRN